METKTSFSHIPSPISLSSIVSATRDQVSSLLDQEAVILHLKSGIYYGLNPLGARIWDMVQQPVAVNCIKDVLVEEYAVSAEQCQHDLLRILDKLRAAHLIEVKDARDG